MDVSADGEAAPSMATTKRWSAVTMVGTTVAIDRARVQARDSEQARERRRSVTALDMRIFAEASAVLVKFDRGDAALGPTPEGGSWGPDRSERKFNYAKTALAANFRKFDGALASSID